MSWPAAGRASLLAALLVLGGAQACSSPASRGILLENDTDADLVFVYLTPDPRDDADGPSTPQEYQVVELGPGGSEVILPVPREGTCTVAPMVARAPGGIEVARLPAGTCWDPVYRWEVDQGGS